MNATKHGERSAKSRATWRELNAALRALTRHERDRANALDGAARPRLNPKDETWMQRIADELHLSNCPGS